MLNSDYAQILLPLMQTWKHLCELTLINNTLKWEKIKGRIKIRVKTLCVGKEFRYQAMNSGKILAVYYYMDNRQVQCISVLGSHNCIFHLFTW